MVAQIYFKNFSKLIFFVNLKLPLRIFQQKKNEILFLVNLHYFFEHYEARKDEGPI